MKKKILVILIIIVLLIAALWGINRYLGGFMIHEDGISIAFPKKRSTSFTYSYYINKRN